MKVGIGYSNIQDAARAGRQVARQAAEAAGIREPTLVIGFCSGAMDHQDFFQGLQSVVGTEVPVVGGSAAGIITNDRISYEGFPAGAAVVESDSLLHQTAFAGDIHLDEKSAGTELARKLADAIEAKLLLIFYDSIKRAAARRRPPEINASPPLIEGIERLLTPKVPIIGAGVVGDFAFNRTRQFCGSKVAGHSVVGTLLGGDIVPYFCIMHGCTPKDGIYHTITRAEGPVIYELDGRPIVEMIDAQYGSRDWRRQVPVGRLTIGVNLGEKYDAFREDNFVNRLITGVLPGGEGIALFEPDLKAGTDILFMLRSNKMMIDSARENSTALFESIRSDGRRPVLGLYIDCAGRTAKMSESLSEEAEEVQNACNRSNTPLLGFYSGVEVAPLQGKSVGLDWTGVLLVLAEKETISTPR